jgi:hypothetical protein
MKTAILTILLIATFALSAYICFRTIELNKPEPEPEEEREPCPHCMYNFFGRGRR